MYISLLLEKEGFIVVSKPAMLNTIPGHKEDDDCLLKQLEIKRKEKLWVVHRLDKEVSGIVMFARNEHYHKYLNHLFFSHTVEKSYLALVIGNIKEKEGIINAPVREYGSGRMGVGTSGGKESETKYSLISKGHGHSLLQVMPLTGRRHQIRVHLYHIGFPIAGDLKYGDKKQQTVYPRLMLHSFTLQFPMENGEVISLRCNPPEEFKYILAQYGIKGISKLKNQMMG